MACRLDAVEYAGNCRQAAKRGINTRQQDQECQRGQHEQCAGDHAAPGFVHYPADVDRKLGGLGAGQHHAVIECMQKAALGYRALTLDQVLAHDRDLPGCATEADEPEFEPVAERLAERYRRGRNVIGFHRAAGFPLPGCNFFDQAR